MFAYSQTGFVMKAGCVTKTRHELTKCTKNAKPCHYYENGMDFVKNECPPTDIFRKEKNHNISRVLVMFNKMIVFLLPKFVNDRDVPLFQICKMLQKHYMFQNATCAQSVSLKQ